MSLQLRSKYIKKGKPIPIPFTFQGESINPQLSWIHVPEGTQELALYCEDPDAPTAKPIVHWILYGLDPSVRRIPEGLPKKGNLPEIGAKQGLNSFFFSGYTGPNPGFWDKPHRYVFRLFALSEKLDLPKSVGRTHFLKAIEGKVIEEASLMGTYEKTPAQKVKAIAFWIACFTTVGFTWNKLSKGSST